MSLIQNNILLIKDYNHSLGQIKVHDRNTKRAAISSSFCLRWEIPTFSIAFIILKIVFDSHGNIFPTSYKRKSNNLHI